MPTYEYACEACRHEFEEFQSITAAPLKKCPKCGKNRLQRLIGTGAGVIFKGSGFYQTDYRSDSYKKSAEAEKKSAEPATKTADTAATGDASKAAPADKPAASPDASPTAEKAVPPRSEPKASRGARKKKAG